MKVLIYRMRGDGTWPLEGDAGCVALHVKSEGKAMEAAIEFAGGRSYRIEFYAASQGCDQYYQLAKVLEQAALPFPHAAHRAILGASYDV